MNYNFHEPVNIGSPNEMTMKKLVETIVGLTKSKSRIVFKKLPADDPAKRCPNISRAKKVLSWKPKVKVEDGLTQTIIYFKRELEIK